MVQLNMENEATAGGVTGAERAAAVFAAYGLVPWHPGGEGPCCFLHAVLDRGRALLRVYFHSRKVRAAAKALAQALAASREASSWPGDRLPVSEEISVQVERLTRRLTLETEAHNRLEALFRSGNVGHPAAA